MSVGRCAVRRGFFVLRACDHPAVAACASCGKPACAEHIAMVGGPTYCVECQARRGEQAGAPMWRGRSAAFGYRNHYYTNHTPIYWGSSYGSYDDHDHQQFDADPAEPQHDDDPGGSFFDS